MNGGSLPLLLMLFLSYISADEVTSVNLPIVDQSCMNNKSLTLSEWIYIFCTHIVLINDPVMIN